jgi:arylsulfatase A-like enzyme
MKNIKVSLLFFALLSTLFSNELDSKKYNVVFIAIDDLNDWIGPLGGNPQAKTPNFDQFAKESITFNKAYCPSTVCGPSRSAILLGKFCYNTGVYGNETNLKDAPLAKDLETLPEYFGNRGYHTLSSGKIFHKHRKSDGTMDHMAWAFHEHVPENAKKWGLEWEILPKLEGVKAYGGDVKWGATQGKLEETKDYVTMDWGAKQLNRDFQGKPFFMALGISQPHLPWNVPQEFFDRYPLEDIILPEIKMDDYEDILTKDGKPVYGKEDASFTILEHHKMHRDATRAYLANVSYVDACLGHFLDQLKKSPCYENTIVVIWSDHGWHLGEKKRYGKVNFWEESARIPFFMRVPNLSPEGVQSDAVVNLVDMYPTLLDLCGLPENQENDGRSLVPVLTDPNMEWNEPTVITWQRNNHGITDGKFKYIYYGKSNGAEEFYDLKTDPYEHTNLVRNPEFSQLVDQYRKYLPKTNAPTSPLNKNHKGYIKRMKELQEKKKLKSKL